jgi:hypothetical protein
MSADNEPAQEKEASTEPTEISESEMQAISVLTPDQIIKEDEREDSAVHRILADAIRARGKMEIRSEYTGKMHTNYDYASLMLWEAINEGIIHFSDGQELNIQTKDRSWLEILRFAMQHVEGAPNTNIPIGRVNIFKVYMNIDTDKM